MYQSNFIFYLLIQKKILILTNILQQKNQKKKIHMNKQCIQIVNEIKAKSQQWKQTGNFGTQLWDIVSEKIKKFYLNEEQQNQYLGLLADIVQFDLNIQTQNKNDYIGKIAGIVGLRYGKLFTKLQSKQEDALHYLQIMASQQKLPNFALKRSFFDFKFNLNIQATSTKDNVIQKLEEAVDANQLLFVAEHTYKYFKHDMNSIAFLSLYLELSAKQLFKTQKQIKKMEEILKEKIQRLCKIYPQIQINGQLNIKGFEELQLPKNQPKYKFEVVKFPKQAKENHFQQLQNYIFKKAQDAKKQLPLFESLVGPSCKQFGYAFLSGIKIKDKTQKASVWRTIEKLTQSNQFDQKFKVFKTSIYQNYSNKLVNNQMSLQDFVKEEQKQAKLFIQKLINQAQSVVFDSKDLVRGKCIYNKLEDVIKTVRNLKLAIKAKQGQGCKIIQLKNQLVKKNMVKMIIKLPQSIAELQLVAKLDKVTNEFNHKLYEVARSKIYTIVTNLFVHNEKWSKSFLNDVRKNILFICQNKIQVKNRNGIQFKKLYDESQLFFQKIYTQKEIVSNNANPNILSKIQKIKKLISQDISKLGLTVKKQLQQKVNLVPFFYYALQYDNAIKIFGNTNLTDALNKKQSGYLYTLAGHINKNQSKYDFAIENYSKSLTAKQKAYGKESQEYAETLSFIGTIYKLQSKYDLALEKFKLSLAIRQKKQGKNSLTYGLGLGEIGNIYLSVCKYDQALKNYTQSIVIIQKNVGKDSMGYAIGLSNIGIIYQYKNKLQQALQNFKQSATVYQKLAGKHSNFYAQAQGNMANVYSLQGKHQISLNYFKQALNTYQRLAGKISTGYASVLMNIGNIYLAQKKLDLALQTYKQSLAIKQKLVGKNSIEYSRNLMNIGSVYRQQGKLDLAIDYYKQSLIIKQKVVGKNAYQYAQTLHKLGQVYYAQNKHNQALQNFKICEGIYQKSIKQQTPQYSQLVFQMAIIYQTSNKIDISLQYYKKSLTLTEKLKGKDSAQYGQIIFNLGQISYSQNKFNEAMNNFKTSLAIFEKKPGVYSTQYANVLMNMGNVHIVQKNYVGAMQNFKNFLIIKQKIQGKNTIVYAQAATTLGGIYQYLQKYNQALECYKSAQIAYQKLTGKNTNQYGSVLYNLSILYQVLRNYQQSYNCVNQCYLVYAKLVGQNHQNTKQALLQWQKVKAILKI